MTITATAYASTSLSVAVTSSAMLPSMTPTLTSTVSSIGSALSETLFEFLHPQENPFVYIIVPDRKESAKLNCTAFYNGSNDDITITWMGNGRLIYTDTESFRENSKVTTILKVAGKSEATFTCIFHHSSGWNNSRDFIFTVNGKVTVL